MEMISSTYTKVNTVEEAVRQISTLQDALFVAGGTDVFVNKQQGNIGARHLVDISGITALNSLSLDETGLELGAMMTLDALIQAPEVNRYYPVLKEAALAVATPVIRKTATIGGNILCENRCSYYNQSEWWREAVGFCLKCNGDICIATGGKKNCFSKFVSDTAPVLIAYRATVTLVNAVEERIIPLEKLYTGNGVRSIAMEKNMLLKSIFLPRDDCRVVFRKLRPRKSLDFTSLTTAVSIDGKNNLRLVLGGVDPQPVLVEGNLTETGWESLVGTACKKPRVVNNDFYGRAYRKEMIRVFLEDSIRCLGLS